MKKYLRKTISFVLSVLTVTSVLCSTVAAVTFRTGTNGVSDSYKSGTYYKNLSSVSLTGDGRTDVLAIALSQIGYSESNQNGEFSGMVQGNDNYTEYNYNMGSFGSGYGGSAYPWCASFVSFCLLQAGCHDQTRISDWCRKHEGDSRYIWREVSCNRWAKQLRLCGYFKDSAAFDGDYFPIPADLIFFTSNGTTESHIGLVLYCDGENVYTVEGNTSDAAGLEINGGGVYVKAHPVKSSYIRGYGVLPYAVNNDAYNIDYSGSSVSRGSYVSLKAKNVYSTESSESPEYLIPKYSLFSVTQIAANGRLKVICDVDGRIITGYIKNNSDRVIQISSTEAQSGYCDAAREWGYTASDVEGYFAGETFLGSKPQSLSLSLGDGVGVSGWVGFSRKIESFGYYFDNEKNSTVWNIDFSKEASSYEISLGGKYTKRYVLTADTSELEAGEHSAHFVVKLSDGTVCELDSLIFTAYRKNGYIPPAPKIESVSEDCVTLEQTDGYEYSIGGKVWQSSNIFRGLDCGKGVKYSFYQRVAKSGENAESAPSAPLTVEPYELREEAVTSGGNTGGEGTKPSVDTETSVAETTEPPVSESADAITSVPVGEESSETSCSTDENDPLRTSYGNITEKNENVKNNRGCTSSAAGGLVVLPSVFTACVVWRRKRE